MPGLSEKSATQLSAMLATGDLSSRELTESVFQRIDAVEEEVGAYLHLDREGALRQADAVDASRAAGEELHPLAGIPIALKDNLNAIGMPTTCASKILQGYSPVYDAAVVTALRDAGAVFTGKTNMDEFAMGSSTETSHYKLTRNPWDVQRVPGGSSGGSAAAVAAGEAVLSLGSDTGGSIRQPASFCGVVGLKPTYGRVSRYGLVAFASSLDQIGPFGRTVEDCALLLSAIAGSDDRDSTSVHAPVPAYLEECGKGLKGLKAGLPKELMGEGLETDVKEVVQRMIGLLEGDGVSVEEMSLPHFEYALPAYYIIAPAEASSNLARFDGIRYGFSYDDASDLLEHYEMTRAKGFGEEVKRRIMIGTYALSAGYYDAYYGQALKVRSLIKDDFDLAFRKFDFLITPTAPTTSFRIGEKGDDPLQMYLSDVCTIPVNLAGIPALSLPIGLDGKGLPIGLQLIGKAFDEATLLRAASGVERLASFPAGTVPA